MTLRSQRSEALPPFLPKDSLNRFVVATAGSAVALCLLWFSLSNPRTETIDKIYFASALLIGALALLVRFPKQQDSGVTVLGLAGLVVLGWGLKNVDVINSFNLYWGGFRPRVAVASFVLLPLVGFLLWPQLTASKPRRYIAHALLLAVALVGALSFIQTRTSLRLASHAAFVLNEIYAVAAGHYPYADFIPQYQTLFSYLFSPVIALFGGEQALNPILYALSALSLVTVALGVTAGLRATRGLNRVVAPLLILPLVFITHGARLQDILGQGPAEPWWADSIGALHSAFPVRMLVPTLIGVILSAMPVLGAQDWLPRRHILPLGLLLGLGCFHQLDFGLAAGFATGAVILLALPFNKIPRLMLLLLLGAVGGFVTVPVLQWLGDHPLRMDKVGWFLRQFGGGFGSAPIQIPGPVLVVLPLLVGATVTCLAVLKAHRGASLQEPGTDPRSGATGADGDQLGVYRAALIGSYFGVFALAAFPYYLNRSYASGQLQISLMPLGIALAAAARIIAGSEYWAAERRSARSLVFRLAIAIPVASLLLLPSPARELARLRSDALEARWPGPKTESVIAVKGRAKLVDQPGVGYFGMDGNYVQAATGLRNVTRFSSPMDAGMSPAALQELCAGIASPSLRILILGDQALNPSVCPRKWALRRSRSGLLFAVPQEEAPNPAAPAPQAADVESSIFSVRAK